MSTLVTFVHLGFRHITDWEAMDHILFLFALAAIYRFRDWRSTLWVVTAFTIGHSITLALAVTRTLQLRTDIIEFLIPVTIVITALENIVVRDRDRALWKGGYRPAFAGVFGLVHGAGFANYLNSMFVDRVALPLFGFNIGIELGQLTVLAGAFAALAALDAALTALDTRLARGRVPLPATPLRVRAVAVSSIVAVTATHWAIQRNPW